MPFRASVQLLLDVLVEVEKLVPNNNYLLKISGCEDYLFEDKLILPEYKVRYLGDQINSMFFSRGYCLYFIVIVQSAISVENASVKV